jgi:hypothetical protein
VSYEVRDFSKPEQVWRFDDRAAALAFLTIVLRPRVGAFAGEIRPVAP